MTVRTFSFGYVPRGTPREQLRAKFIGTPNLLKRLQAPYLFEHLRPAPGDKLLDFGCGGGFYSAEAANLGASVTAVDVIDNPNLSGRVGAGEIAYRKIEPGQALPYPDGSFDKILISEVLMVLPDIAPVLVELSRVLRPGGRLYCLNAFGRFQIRRGYERKSFVIRLLRRFNGEVPKDYDTYIAELLATNVARKQFYTIDEVHSAMKKVGLEIDETISCCRGVGFSLLYWMQFVGFCYGKSYAVNFSMMRFFLLKLLNTIWPATDDSVSLLIAAKPSSTAD